MLAIIHPRVRDFGNIIGKGSVQLLIIYKATNLVNGKIYIGQTINTLEYRKNQHFREARCEKRKNIYFHNALNKYGEDPQRGGYVNFMNRAITNNSPAVNFDLFGDASTIIVSFITVVILLASVGLIVSVIQKRRRENK